MNFFSIKSCKLLILFCVLESALLWGASTEQNKTSIVFNENFEDCIQQKVGEGAKTNLLQKDFNIDEIEKKLSPRKWSIDWKTLQLGDDFGVKDNHFFIHSTKKFTLYGPLLAPTSQSYQLELTITVPVDSTADETLIELGFYHYGLVTPGPHIVKTVKIAKGKTESITLPFRIDNDFANFRPMLSVSGDLRFDKCVISVDTEQVRRDKKTLIEGTLTEISSIPDPKKSDYPNCRFIARLVGNSIIDGVPCPKEVNLVIEGFRNYKTLNTSQLKSGDKVRLLMLPFESLPEEEKSTQQADDLNLFSLDNYYCIGLSKINDFHDEGEFPESGIYFNNSTIEYVSVFERHINPPILPELVKAQQDAIAADLAKINAMLEPWTDARKAETNKTFKIDWGKEKAKDADKGIGYNRVEIDKRTYIWRNIDNSFWCLPEYYDLVPQKQEISDQKIKALCALRDFCEANGVQFAVMLTPYIYDISCRVINKTFCQVPDFRLANAVKQLLDNQIETIYSSQELLNNYNRFPFAFFFPHDCHPADTTQDVLSDMLTNRLKRYNFKKTLQDGIFSVTKASHITYNNANDYLFPENCDIGDNQPKTHYLCRRVLYNGKDVVYNKASPILILGNSTIRTPMEFPESFPSLMQSKLKTDIDVCYVTGYGPMTTIVKRLLDNAEEFLNGKKIVVWCVNVIHLLSNIEMSNIEYMDNQLKTLNGKTCLGEINLFNGTGNDDKYAGVKNRNVYTVTAKKNAVAEINLSEYNIDNKNNIVVSVNACLLSDQKVTLFVNDIPVYMNKYDYSYLARHADFQIILPADTKKITISIDGSIGHKISIRNLKIFQ